MDLDMGSNKFKPNSPLERIPVQNIPPIQLSSREVATRFHIESVLQIIGLMIPALGMYLHPQRPSEDSAPYRPSTAPANSEAMIAIENTMREACARLDKILSDEVRWSTAFQEEVEKHFRESAKLQLEFYTAQRNAAAELASPHSRFRPTLLRLTDGGCWCAVLGDFDHGIVGIGDTAQAALEAFDSAYAGEVNPKVEEWLKKHEKNIQTGAQDEPFPKINEQDLDRQRDSNPDNPSQGGVDG